MHRLRPGHLYAYVSCGAKSERLSSVRHRLWLALRPSPLRNTPVTYRERTLRCQKKPPAPGRRWRFF